MSVAPSVWKYVALTSRSGTSLCSPCHGRPEHAEPRACSPIRSMGSELVTPTDDTPGRPPTRATTSRVS